VGGRLALARLPLFPPRRLARISGYSRQVAALNKINLLASRETPVRISTASGAIAEVGMSLREIAREFNVHHSTISRMKP